MANKFVRRTGGSNSNDGSSFANGWATLAYAFDSGNANRVAAGDVLCVCTDSTPFTITASLELLFGTYPSVNAPFMMKGYDLSGNERIDGSRSGITTASALANGLIYVSNSSSMYMLFKNMSFDGGGSGCAEYCLYTTNVDGTYGNFHFDNCRFTNADNHGIYMRQAGGDESWVFVNCEIDHNGAGGTGDGLSNESDVRGGVRCYGCKIYHNDGIGMRVGASSHFERCLFYRNGDDGLAITQWFNGVASYVDNCVFYLNGNDGIDTYTASINIMNTVMMDNGAYGIRFGNTDMDNVNFYFLKNNCVHGNTSGATNVNSGTLPGSGHITSDPLFTSTTDGSEDFTLKSSSPCKDAGLDVVGY